MSYPASKRPRTPPPTSSSSAQYISTGAGSPRKKKHKQKNSVSPQKEMVASWLSRIEPQTAQAKPDSIITNASVSSSESMASLFGPSFQNAEQKQSHAFTEDAQPPLTTEPDSSVTSSVDKADCRMVLGKSWSAAHISGHTCSEDEVPLNPSMDSSNDFLEPAQCPPTTGSDLSVDYQNISFSRKSMLRSRRSKISYREESESESRSHSSFSPEESVANFTRQQRTRLRKAPLASAFQKNSDASRPRPQTGKRARKQSSQLRSGRSTKKNASATKMHLPMGQKSWESLVKSVDHISPPKNSDGSWSSCTVYFTLVNDERRSLDYFSSKKRFLGKILDYIHEHMFCVPRQE